MAKVFVKGRDGKNYIIEESELDPEKHCIDKDKCDCKPSKKSKDKCGGNCGSGKNNCGSSQTNARSGSGSKNGSSLDDLFDNCPDKDDNDDMFDFDFGDLGKMFGPIDTD